MNTLRGTVLRTSYHKIKNYTDSVGETGTGGNFFHMPHHGTFVRRTLQHNTNYMTVVMYKVTGLTCTFVYSMSLQPAGINQLVTHTTLYFSTRDQQPTIMGVDLCHKNVGHPWFSKTRVTWYQPLYQFIMPDSILYAKQIKKAANKHVKIT